MRPAKTRRERRPPAAETPWLYGIHAIAAALRNPKRRCRHLVVAPDAAALLDWPDGVAAETLSRSEISRLLPAGAVHQGIAALFDPLPSTSLDELLEMLGDDRTVSILVLDQVTDPRNVGAILRSAAGFGCRAVVMQDRHSPPFSGALVKAASGGAETVPLVKVTNLARTLDALKEAGFWCIGLDSTGTECIGHVDLGGRVALVLGAEGSGLRRLTRARCDRLVRIPIGDAVQSLNVSAAATIALYEWSRAK
jgi:23S rRNA (guanosine2251-2'-O)-methyltransferase